MKKSLFAFVAVVLLSVCLLAACSMSQKVTFVVQDEADTRQTVTVFDASKIPTFTNGDKVFGGWYLDAECTEGNEWVFDGKQSEVTVYAKWNQPASAQTVAIVVFCDGDKVVLQKSAATEEALKSAIKVLAIGSDGSKTYVTDYTVQGLDLTAVGSEQTVTVNYEGCREEITVVVKEESVSAADLTEVFNFYADRAEWNFSVNYTCTCGGETIFVNTVNYNNGILQYTYDYYGTTYTEYVVFDSNAEATGYYVDNGDGTYDKIDGSDPFFDYYVTDADCVLLDNLAGFSFHLEGDGYVADKPQQAGNALLQDWGEDCTWQSVKLIVSDGKISKIVAVQEDVSAEAAGTYTFVLTLTKYGQMSFALPQTGGSQGGETSDLQEGVAYKLAVDQETLNKTLYAVNSLSNSYYIASATSKADAPDVYLQLSDGGFYMYFDGTTKTYINATVSGQHVNMTLSSSATTLWRYDQQYKCICTEEIFKGESTVIYIASYGSYNTFAARYTTSSPTSTDFLAYLVLSDSGSSGGTSTGVMPNQIYNPDTFNYDNLQQAMMKSDQASDYDPAIGLPSVGTYSVLVVPVKFSNTTISNGQYDNLNIAFNGTSEETGWESVKTYYQKSSYGQLNLSFDIWGYNIGTKYSPYVSTKKYQSYANSTDEYGYMNGDIVLLEEVLAYLEKVIDLTKYDTNGDGCIDAVYLVYSAEVDYLNAGFWWAYVSWDTNDVQYDGLCPYYYNFTGFDFMQEEMRCGAKVAVNAETYIHETGHLLGLDDYYDYEIGVGSDSGLGGVAMQDNNIGDQDVYSKIMMGWLTPTVVNSTTTVTIDLSNDNPDDDCVLIFLNGNNSYFCEYLLIDLYSATGLNAISSAAMYDGAQYGARIYHVSSSCDNPYSDDYSSFTNYNNSISDIALIKLVEADGQYSKNSNANDGTWATESDLWQTGDKLSQSFNGYKRNDGKTVNFDIEFVLVDATTAQIVITFVEQ